MSSYYTVNIALSHLKSYHIHWKMYFSNFSVSEPMCQKKTHMNGNTQHGKMSGEMAMWETL